MGQGELMVGLLLNRSADPQVQKNASGRPGANDVLGLDHEVATVGDDLRASEGGLVIP